MLQKVYLAIYYAYCTNSITGVGVGRYLAVGIV